MAERLAGGNAAIATGAILYALITMLGLIFGAHFNPAASVVFRLKSELNNNQRFWFVGCQITDGVLGTLVAYLMFDMVSLEPGEKAGTGASQWFAEGVPPLVCWLPYQAL